MAPPAYASKEPQLVTVVNKAPDLPPIRFINKAGKVSIAEINLVVSLPDEKKALVARVPKPYLDELNALISPDRPEESMALLRSFFSMNHSYLLSQYHGNNSRPFRTDFLIPVRVPGHGRPASPAIAHAAMPAEQSVVLDQSLRGLYHIVGKTLTIDQSVLDLATSYLQAVPLRLSEVPLKVPEPLRLQLTQPQRIVPSQSEIGGAQGQAAETERLTNAQKEITAARSDLNGLYIRAGRQVPTIPSNSAFWRYLRDANRSLADAERALARNDYPNVDLLVASAMDSIASGSAELEPKKAVVSPLQKAETPAAPIAAAQTQATAPSKVTGPGKTPAQVRAEQVAAEKQRVTVTLESISVARKAVADAAKDGIRVPGARSDYSALNSDLRKLRKLRDPTARTAAHTKLREKADALVKKVQDAVEAAQKARKAAGEEKQKKAPASLIVPPLPASQSQLSTTPFQGEEDDFSARQKNTAYDGLQKARSAADVRSAMSPLDEDDKNALLSKLSPSDRGRLLAFLTSAERDELGIYPIITEDILSNPHISAYRAKSDMGFDISNVISISIPENMIRSKNYTQMRGLIQARLRAAVQEEQAQLPADKRMSDKAISDAVTQIMSHLSLKNLEGSTGKILESLQKDDTAAAKKAASEKRTITIDIGHKEYSVVIPLAELQGKNQDQITSLFMQKANKTLEKDIPNKGKREKILQDYIKMYPEAVKLLQ